MDGPSQSQHLNSYIVIHKLGAKEARLSLKLTHHVMHKESGGEGELVQWLTVETAHIVMGLEGSNSSDIPMTQSCVKDGSLK